MVRVECADLEDMEAARATLRAMYTQTVEPPCSDLSSTKMLLKIAGWASGWLSSSVLSMCGSSLAQTKVSEMRDDDMMCMLHPKLSSISEYYAPIEAMCRTWMLLHFRDVWRVVQDEQLLARFRSLPFAAVRTLAATDDLISDCESDVLTLLTLWCAASQSAPSSLRTSVWASCRTAFGPR